jgi:hypothetical protein
LLCKKILTAVGEEFPSKDEEGSPQKDASKLTNNWEQKVISQTFENDL